MTVPSTPVQAYDPPNGRSSPSSLPSPPVSPRFNPGPKLQSRSSSYSRPTTLRPHLRRSKPSLLDELLPTPTTFNTPNQTDSLSHVIRRAGSVAVITIFLLSITFMASTTTTSPAGILKGGAKGLKEVFGVGNQADVGSWISQDIQSSTHNNDDSQEDITGSEGISDTDSESEPSDEVRPDVDFDHYKMLRTLPSENIDITSKGKRLIFIGDIHGSYDPFIRLMDKISYSPSTDRLIHVGDLIAKGSKHNEVLWWMNERRILGVRGNHDQAVIQWRGWMEWAGGEDWEAYIDSLSSGDEDGAIKATAKQGKQWPRDWKWKGEHWEIARALPKRLYLYLLDLPLVIHLPSLHSIVVHAGILPLDPLQPSSSPVQPLIQFSNFSTMTKDMDVESIRNSEEVSLLFDIPQNAVPWNLLNMRGVFTKGKKKGKITKSGKKGTPWSDIWSKQMKRCNGIGKWTIDGMGEKQIENINNINEDIENQEDTEVDEVDHPSTTKTKTKRQKPGTPNELQNENSDDQQIGCSPVTVIYGHAAGRGLDIKPFSKGLDTGCVYGRQLTVMVLGDLKGLKGDMVRVGDHQGILVNEQCGEGGT
ncbi:uncharacterized protein IL334_001879 [Kwoniella shivajii]|uniref:Calcineurin-like phosphoesterase domain-containing protein n=1 Tax=Kwoniella shivajii TaxID=564305 RepID=A0ABZ1CUS3_9TREE|nr:hypothetical protein IL334_001879 [Kwoniella shivajii]